jgi:hypothetical protein
MRISRWYLKRGHDHVLELAASPPPWSVEELDACFVVTDSAGQKLAYVYFEDEPCKMVACP